MQVYGNDLSIKPAVIISSVLLNEGGEILKSVPLASFAGCELF